MFLIRVTVIGLASMALAGCSVGNLLGGGSSAPPQTVQVGNQLALPPDLSLRAPSQTADAYVPNGPVTDQGAAQQASLAKTAPYAAAPGAAVPKRTGGSLDETLAFYGISKTKPDGSAKTAAEINAELRAAILAEKRRQNPNYGTIRNIGAIFSDG